MNAAFLRVSRCGANHAAGFELTPVKGNTVQTMNLAKINSPHPIRMEHGPAKISRRCSFRLHVLERRVLSELVSLNRRTAARALGNLRRARTSITGTGAGVRLPQVDRDVFERHVRWRQLACALIRHERPSFADGSKAPAVAGVPICWNTLRAAA